jgi:RNA polymerase sigma-70 factor (ECF subfamily)
MRSAPTSVITVGLPASERDLVDALRRGDERAFAGLVERHGASMLRLARAYERDPAVAEEIVQDAWIGLLRGIDRFEGRSSLRTWLFRIVANVARTRAAREERSVPLSALFAVEGDERSVPPERFRGPGHPREGHWSEPPQEWSRPEHELMSAETRMQIAAAIGALPQSQRVVITLRDVEGWSTDEVCALLQISEGNQRVLLHRARTRVRQALDHYLTAP